MTITKRCTVCGRFRAYDADDQYCIVCGHDGLETECSCGRTFDYALAEGEGSLHCPRCGKVFRGPGRDYE